MASDLEQLIEMGFEPERARMAVSKTGGCMSTVTTAGLPQMLSLSSVL